MSIRSLAFALMTLVGSARAVTNQAIVVSAPRLDDLDLMAVDVAADVTVIDRSAIERSGATSVPELLQGQANVLIRDTTGMGRGGQISMRGFGENSHLRTLVLVDGHRMNRPDMAGINWLEIPPESIERIEVIRGGQNVLYGDHAVGGVVKITTKRGEDAGLQLGGAFGSFGHLSGSLGYGAAAGDVDYHVGASGFTLDGYRVNSAAKAATLSGSLGWFLNHTDTLTLRASVTDASQEYPGALTYEEMLADPTRSSNAGGLGSDALSGLATLIWETEREWGAARVSSGLNIRDLDWRLSNTVGNNQMIGFSLGPRVRRGDEETFFMGGVDALYDGVDFTDLHPAETDYAQARADLERVTVAPYVFAQKKFDRSYTINGGLRYEVARTDNTYVDYVDDQILPYEDLLGIGRVPNPNYKNPPDIDSTNSYTGVITKRGWAAEVALARDLGEGDSVWIGYDRLYRYPTLDEAASYQGYPLSDPLNENLDPETGNNFELGGRFAEGRWGGSLTTFLLLMDDEIAFVETPANPPSQPDPIRLNMNMGSTTRVGVEMELSHARRWWGASTRWSFVNATFRGGENDGNTVPLVPWGHGFVSGWIDPAAYLRLGATWSCVAEQYQGGDVENDLRKMDAYGLLGLRANIRMNDQAALVIAIDNVFDKTYASAAYYNGFYPGAGRSFRVSLNMEF